MDTRTDGYLSQILRYVLYSISLRASWLRSHNATIPVSSQLMIMVWTLGVGAMVLQKMQNKSSADLVHDNFMFSYETFQVCPTLIRLISDSDIQQLKEFYDFRCQ